MRTTTCLGGLLGALLVFTSMGCGSSSCEPAFTGLTGTWEIEEQETSPDPTCNRFSVYSREVVQDGSDLTIITPEEVFEVSLCGNTITLPTPYMESEDGGTTTVTQERWTILSPTSATGTSTWTWTGAGRTCQGTSTMTATKQP